MACNVKTAGPRRPRKKVRLHSFSHHVLGVNPHMALHWIQPQLSSHTARFHACVCAPVREAPSQTRPNRPKPIYSSPAHCIAASQPLNTSGTSKSTMLIQPAQLQSSHGGEKLLRGWARAPQHPARWSGCSRRGRPRAWTSWHRGPPWSRQTGQRRPARTPWPGGRS